MKYRIKYTNNEYYDYSIKLNVKTKDDTITVKDKSTTLYNKDREGVKCLLVNNGDGITVLIGNEKINLSHNQMLYLHAALLMEITLECLEYKVINKEGRVENEQYK